MILIEITAAIDAAGTLQTFYVGSDSFVTSPADTPASVAFDPRLIDPGTLGVNIFSDGRTGGTTKLETGEIVLANADGALDAWLNYSFDGRPVTIRAGNGGAYPGAFATILVGTIESAEASWDKFVLRLKDKQQLFALPALTTRYAGNNALPAGLEGTASDLGGKVKPRTHGKVFNVSAPLVNTSKLTYEVGACFAINAVYDRGLAITAGADFATTALLQAAAPAAGTYITCLVDGYFRLGSTPAGQITADVTQGAAAASRTVAQIIKQLAINAGLSAGEISAADVTALDAAAPQVVGIWLSDESSFAQAMDLVAASVGAWYGFDAAGVLRLGQITTPAGAPVVTLYDYDTLAGFERRPPRDNGIPVWRVVLGHTRIWTTQPSDLAGAVTTATRAYLAEPARKAASEDAAIKTQWLLAGTAEDDTLLTVAAEAATEAARRLALYKTRRDIFDVPVSVDLLTLHSLKLGDVVALQVARFGLDVGKNFRIIGIRLALAAGTATLALWG
ncbi:hypothetical protein [Polaromonas sp.]|uniref:hypothetical protein n=1 Tax=Polaromonas sp. TaxID=1869339 RepID=UPI003563C017